MTRKQPQKKSASDKNGTQFIQTGQVDDADSLTAGIGEGIDAGPKEIVGPIDDGCRGIEDKIRLLAELKQSEESYRRVMALSPDAITISRVADGKFFEVNEAFCQITGYTRDEVIGRRAEDLKIYANIEDRQRIVDTVRTGGGVSGMRCDFRSKDGSPLYSIIAARIVQFKGEECILSVATSINSLVEAQEALKESEKRYREILNAAPDPICLTSMRDGRYIEANEQFYINTGWTPQETIGRTALELNIYADPNDRKRLLDALRKTGQVDGMEIKARYKNGSVSETLWSCRRIEYKGEQCLLVVAKEINELKKAQQAAQEREDRYRTVLDNAPYTIVISRRTDATYLEVNEAFVRRTGYTREEAIGRTPYDLNIYDDPTDRENLMAALNRDGSVHGMELRFRDKQGRLLESLVSVSPIIYQGESCLLIMTVDISELKRVQRELAMSEESYRTIMEAAPNAMEILSVPDLRYVAVNKTFCRNLGYTKEEIIGKSAQELTILDDYQSRQIIERLQKDKKIDRMEIQALTSDGRILDSLLSITPIHHMGKRCFLTTNVDVTELKKTEAALRESEARFRTIFETAADAIFVTDMQGGRFLDVNQAACELLGYSAATLMKMHLNDITSEAHPYQVPMKTTADGKQSKRIFFESVHVDASGNEIPVEVSCGVIERSGMPALLSIVRGVSERKLAEEELARYRKHLEAMVQKRTRALEEAQSELLKSERLSVLGQLTATVSHELRNPLGVIRSSSFYLKRKFKGMDAKIEKHISRIEEQVSICETIVADLLEYTRGRQPSLENQEVVPWLEKVVEQMAESENFNIKLDINSNLPSAPHDQEKMRRVVINLLDNAIQAARARQEEARASRTPYKPVVELTVFRNKNDLVLQVKDNGIGMDEQTRNRAFEPLFTTRARGTGIGLANVRKIISEHCGRIELETKENEGTTIKIVLPCESAFRHPQVLEESSFDHEK